MLPAAGPAEVGEPVLRRTTPGRSRPAARQVPFLPVLRGATVGFFLLFFALAAPSVSLERRFVPGGRLPDRPFATIPTDLGPAATALACAKMVAQLSVVLTAVLAPSRSWARRRATSAGQPGRIPRGQPMAESRLVRVRPAHGSVPGLLERAAFGPAITISHATARARPHRLPPSWPEGKPIDVEAALTDLKSDNRGTRLMALGRLQGAGRAIAPGGGRQVAGAPRHLRGSMGSRQCRHSPGRLGHPRKRSFALERPERLRVEKMAQGTPAFGSPANQGPELAETVAAC